MNKRVQKNNTASLNASTISEALEAENASPDITIKVASATKKAKEILFIFASQKGGVGKSFLCTTLVEYLQYGCVDPVEVLIIDCDTKNRTLTRRYGPDSYEPSCKTRSLKTLSLDDRDHIEQLLSSIENGPQFVVMDLPAADENSLRQMFPDVPTMDLVFEALGYQVCIVLPVTSQSETSAAAHSMVKLFGSSVSYLLICNPYGNRSQSLVEEGFNSLFNAIQAPNRNIVGAVSHVLAVEGCEDVERNPTVPYTSVASVIRSEKARGLSSNIRRAGILSAFLNNQNIFWDGLIKEVSSQAVRRPGQDGRK